MFSVYGISGPTFTGTLEELNRVAAVTRARAVNAVAPDRLETGPTAPAGIGAAGIAAPGEAAIRAYRATVQLDLERGPLYHAAQIMRRQVVVVPAEAYADAAWQVLHASRVHQAPVLDAAQRLVGLVSERDLLTSFNLEHDEVRDVLDRRVRDVMTSPVVSADPVTDIRRIARVMLDHGVDGVPIVDASHTLVGFVSRSDILNAVIADPPLSLWR